MTQQEKPMHEELKTAIKEKDYGTVCQFLHTNHFSSDSEWTVGRCNDSFIQGWKECEKQKDAVIEKLVEALKWIAGCVSDVEECALCLEEYLTELQEENARLKAELSANQYAHEINEKLRIGYRNDCEKLKAELDALRKALEESTQYYRCRCGDKVPISMKFNHFCNGITKSQSDT